MTKTTISLVSASIAAIIGYTIIKSKKDGDKKNENFIEAKEDAMKRMNDH